MDMVQNTVYENGRVTHNWIKTRPIPENEFWFENVWKQYREYRNGKED